MPSAFQHRIKSRDFKEFVFSFFPFRFHPVFYLYCSSCEIKHCRFRCSLLLSKYWTWKLFSEAYKLTSEKRWRTTFRVFPFASARKLFVWSQARCDLITTVNSNWSTRIKKRDKPKTMKVVCRWKSSFRAHTWMSSALPEVLPDLFSPDWHTDLQAPPVSKIIDLRMGQSFCNRMEYLSARWFLWFSHCLSGGLAHFASWKQLKRWLWRGSLLIESFN